MSRNKSRTLFFASVAALLVVVGLLAFGEEARHGRYHLDGGRGWDLPAPTSVDFAHVQFHPVIRPKVTTVVGRNIQPTTERALPTEVSSLQLATSTISVKRRPPPEL
ncbi:MAG: hypothetical protein ACRD1J_05395 [Terriglobia bacterium]